MAYPSVTYTFSNGTTASATEVNQNFTDLVNGMSDGTKDLNISAITAAGAATFNGTVALGNATGDDVTITGYVASAIVPKTDDTYDLGTAALAWQDGYFDGLVYTDAISQLGTGGISVTGALIPNADDTHDLGTAALAWKDAYFDGTVYSDAFKAHTTSGLSISEYGGVNGLRIANSTAAVTIGPDNADALQHNIWGYVKCRRNTTSTSASIFTFYDGANQYCGGIEINASTDQTTFATSSDGRLKANHLDFNGLSMVNEIKATSYERIRSGVREIGIVAQELFDIFPQAVRVGGDDFESNPWGIDYGKLTPILLKAIQELSAKFDEANARIAALESR